MLSAYSHMFRHQGAILREFNKQIQYILQVLDTPTFTIKIKNQNLKMVNF